MWFASMFYSELTFYMNVRVRIFQYSIRSLKFVLRAARSLYKYMKIESQLQLSPVSLQSLLYHLFFLDRTILELLFVSRKSYKRFLHNQPDT